MADNGREEIGSDRLKVVWAVCEADAFRMWPLHNTDAVVITDMMLTGTAFLCAQPTCIVTVLVI